MDIKINRVAFDEDVMLKNLPMLKAWAGMFWDVWQLDRVMAWACAWVSVMELKRELIINYPPPPKHPNTEPVWVLADPVTGENQFERVQELELKFAVMFRTYPARASMRGRESVREYPLGAGDLFCLDIQEQIFAYIKSHLENAMYEDGVEVGEVLTALVHPTIGVPGLHMMNRAVAWLAIGRFFGQDHDLYYLDGTGRILLKP